MQSSKKLPLGVDAENAFGVSRAEQRLAASEERREPQEEALCRKASPSAEGASSVSVWNANAFTSIPPQTGAVVVEGEESLAPSEASLLPLGRRPYFVDGFDRLPPLPKDQALTGWEEQRRRLSPLETSLLDALASAKQLCRFDAPQNFLEGVKSSSRVTIFRRRSPPPQ